MSDIDSWKPISEQEWQRRLAGMRVLAQRRLARVGINIDAETEDGVPSVAGLVLDGPEGAALLPQLADAQAIAIAAIDSIGNPKITVGDDDFNALSDLVYAYAMGAAEAGYLFGVIVGANTSWPVVAGLEPPCAPPAAPHRVKKGGRR